MTTPNHAALTEAFTLQAPPGAILTGYVALATYASPEDDDPRWAYRVLPGQHPALTLGLIEYAHTIAVDETDMDEDE